MLEIVYNILYMYNLLLPPHQNKSRNFQKNGDWGGFFPTLKSAEEYANSVKQTNYHKDRLRALKYLLTNKALKCKTSHKLNIVDFGIGDGSEFLQLKIKPKKLIGIDISQHMINLAALSIKKNFIGLVGSTEVLKKIQSNSIDLILCINTLGYLTKRNQNLFFKESQRILKKNAFLVVMTGNELFDMYSLNSGTADFFKINFNQKVSSLLTFGLTKRFKNAFRKNPLNFASEIKLFGFNEIQQSFSQWHNMLPPIANIKYKNNLLIAREKSRNHNFDPNKLKSIDKWKAFFCCSMFASLAQKI